MAILRRHLNAKLSTYCNEAQLPKPNQYGVVNSLFLVKDGTKYRLERVYIPFDTIWVSELLSNREMLRFIEGMLASLEFVKRAKEA